MIVTTGSLTKGDKMELRMVTKSDYRFLYDLLAERETEQSISHLEMPTWEQHVAFNEGKPYKRDFIIVDGTDDVGRLYLTKNNEVGISIRQTFQHFGRGSRALKLFLKSHQGPVYANIAPSNTRSQAFFRNHGFKLVQLTFKR